MPLLTQQYLVLDYGTTHMKGVLVRAGMGSTRIMRMESLPHVRLLDAEGESEQYEYNITRFIQSFFPEETSVILLLPGEDVYVRDIVMPVSQAKQIAELMPFEVENLIPIPLEEAEVLGKAWDIGKEQSSVITFTASHEAIRKSVEPLSRSQSMVRMLSIETVGLGSLHKSFPKETFPRVYGQIDIGGKHTVLNIIKDSELVYSRILYVGGEDVTEAAAEILKTDAATAEQRKRDLLIDLSEGDRRSSQPESFYRKNKITEKDYQRLVKAARSVVKEVADEVERTVLALNDFTPELFYLSGGGSLFPGTDAFFTRELEMSVQRYPVELSNGQSLEVYATAIGASEHFRIKSSQRMDYLSSPFGSTLQKGEFSLQNLSTPAIVASASVLLLLGSFLAGIILDKNQIRKYQAQAGKLAREIPGVRSNEDPIGEAEKICRDRLKSLEGPGYKALDVLAELSNRTPGKDEIAFRLKSLTYDTKDVQFEAEVDSYNQIGKIEEQYRSSGMFQSVEVTKRDLLPTKKVRLAMKLTLKRIPTSTQISCK